MKNFFSICIAAAGIVIIMSTLTCSLGTATVDFKLTDAPLTEEFGGVYVKFDSIEINESGSASELANSWIRAETDPSVEYNLLDLENGVSAMLGQVELRGGTQINQIRFNVASGCYVIPAAGGDAIPLTVASGSVKIVNAFDIPLNGSITIMADFDARKSLVEIGAGVYQLTPRIRAIVENEAGSISGTISESGALVCAYADNTYTAGQETTDPPFDGAVTSAMGESDNTYRLSYLAAGVYDLVVVDAADTVRHFDDITVQSAKNTVYNLSW